MCWILSAGIRNSLTCQTKPWADATILADNLIVGYARFYGIPVPIPTILPTYLLVSTSALAQPLSEYLRKPYDACTYIIRVRGSVVSVDFTRVGGGYRRCGITYSVGGGKRRRECFGEESREMNSFGRVDLRNTLSWHNIIPCCLAFGELRVFQKIVGNLVWGQSNESIQGRI